MRSALKARQKSAKDSLLQQLPTIGQRDRRKPSVDMTLVNPGKCGAVSMEGMGSVGGSSTDLLEAKMDSRGSQLKRFADAVGPGLHGLH